MHSAETKSDLGWVTRRLHAMPLSEVDDQQVQIRTINAFSGCVGLMLGVWLFVGSKTGTEPLIEIFSAVAAFCVTATFLISRLFRSAYWPGMWVGSWSIIAVSVQLLAYGEQASIMLLPLVAMPAIFGLLISARASAIATGLVCLVYLAAASKHLLGGGNADSSFVIELLLCAVCTSLCGGLMAYLTFGREQEDRKLVSMRDGLRRAATMDSLTGVGNRRAFDQKVRLLTIEASRQVKPALMLFDVDKFKLINDTHGHAVGDHVLVTIAERISGVLENGETLFRLGGDEFAIVFDTVGQRSDVEKAALRLVSVLHPEVMLPATSLKVNVSVGLALSDGGGLSISELYSKADTASFVAKEHIGTKVIAYNSLLSSKITRRRLVETQLNLALAHQQIQLAFQPQIDLVTNTVVGFEALARWTDPKLGVVNPDEFVSVAEQSSLIDKFDRFVVSRSLVQARSWLGPAQRISINASARSIVSAEFTRFVIDQVEDSGLRPDQVEIEITETALIANWEACRANVESLRRAGVRIVLDDFGIGYSSLSYLSQFPAQKLKFDRTFLLECKSSSSIIVMQTIVQLAEALNMEVIAEGVDNPLHVSLLKQIRCQSAQGFLYSKPIMHHEMESYARKLRHAARTAEEHKSA